MRICVIDNNKKASETDFVELFNRIDKTVHVTVYKITDGYLIDKLKVTPVFDGIILTGSERRVLSDNNAFQLPSSLLELGIPVLGICYGFQWMAHVSGGTIATFENKELHRYEKYIKITKPFAVSKRKYKFFHHDYVSKLPNTFDCIVRMSDMIVVACQKEKRHMGVQFHPERHISSSTEFFRKWLIFLRTNIRRYF